MSVAVDIPGDLRASVEAASQGRATVRYTDKGQPSFFYRIPKFQVEDIDASLGTGTHPAFVVDGAEKDEILVGLHHAAEVNGEAVSQPGMMPRVSINHDEVVALARATGAGFCAATTPMYAALALLARHSGRYPRGNNNNGVAWNATGEYGVDVDGNSTAGGGVTGALRTGSGPVAWNWPADEWGMQGLNGNVWEWSPGQRIVDGEIQIIADNDAVLAGTDLSTSGPWQAIHRTTGALIAPGSADAVHYAASGTADGTLVGSSGSDFSGYTAHGVEDAALHRLRQYGLAPPLGGGMESDNLWHTLTGERLPFRGGLWNNSSGAGAFALYLGYARSARVTSIGFRPAFVI